MGQAQRPLIKVAKIKLFLLRRDAKVHLERRLAARGHADLPAVARQLHDEWFCPTCQAKGLY